MIVFANWSSIDKNLYFPRIQTRLNSSEPLLIQSWNESFDISNESVIFVSGYLSISNVRWLANRVSSSQLVIGVELDASNLVEIANHQSLNVFDHVFVYGDTPYALDVIRLTKFIGTPYMHMSSNPIELEADASVDVNDASIILFLQPSLHTHSRKVYKCTKFIEELSSQNKIYFARTHYDGSDSDECGINQTYMNALDNDVDRFYHINNYETLQELMNIAKGCKRIVAESLIGKQIACKLGMSTICLDTGDTGVNNITENLPPDQQLMYIVNHNQKRHCKVNYDRLESVKKKCEDHFERLIGSPSFGNKCLSYKNAVNVSKAVCYEITGIIGSKYEWGFHQKLLETCDFFDEMVDYTYKQFIKDSIKTRGEINMSVYNQDNFKGLHRAGWQYVVDSMRCLDSPFGLMFDTYLDRTFVWGSDVLEQKGIIPYTSPWMGFFHHTFDSTFSKNNCKVAMQNPLFIQSLPSCMAIVCLSTYLVEEFRYRLASRFPHIKFIRLFHPSSFVDDQWNLNAFVEKRIKLVNIGAWYRNPFSIYAIETNGKFDKFALHGREMHQNFPPASKIVIDDEMLDTGYSKNKWIQYCVDYMRRIDISTGTYHIDDDEDTNMFSQMIRRMKRSVTELSKLSNDDYDKLLTECVVFLDLVDASACNTLIECIVRNVPICINRIQPVVEYLREDYPLYYNSIDEVPTILTRKNIIAAHLFISNMDKDFLRVENFVNNIQKTLPYKHFAQVTIDPIID